MYPPRTGLFLAHPYCRLPASEVGMIIDKGVDFPQEIDAALRTYGESMWFFREQPDAATTRALNTYTGDHREYVPGGQIRAFLISSYHMHNLPPSSFQYLTPRIRITPCDLTDTPLSRPTTLHFICSPARAAVIMSQVAQDESWSPLSIYEPIPVSYDDRVDRCNNQTTYAVIMPTKAFV